MGPETHREEPGFWADTFRFVIISIIIILPIRLFIAQPFIVSGKSMSPTFEDKEYLIVDEISYRFEEPARGDVVIFKYPGDTSVYFIKRIIGLPGETVAVRGSLVEITKADGTKLSLSEPYVAYSAQDQTVRTLEKGEYFVMGDNRAESFDSRRWGELPRSHIIGRALVRLFPFSKITLEPGAVEPSAYGEQSDK